jgi:hypothetical protein
VDYEGRSLAECLVASRVLAGVRPLAAHYSALHSVMPA